MITRKRRRAAVIFVFSLLVAIIAVLLFIVFVFRGGSVGTGRGAGQLALSDDSFTISGDVIAPILPGHPVPLNLTISNPHKAPMIVTGLTVAVVAVNAPTASAAYPCTVKDFTLVQMPRKLTVAIGASTRHTLLELGVRESTLPRLMMRDTRANQDGCKGASLTLAYSAAGEVSR